MSRQAHTDNLRFYFMEENNTEKNSMHRGRSSRITNKWMRLAGAELGQAQVKLKVVGEGLAKA